MLKEGDVQLRRLQLKDATTLATLANNKKIWDQLRDAMPHPYAEQDATTFITSAAEENPLVTFAILYKDALCGVVSLVPQTDVYAHNAEIGYWLGESFWGKGIATIAVKLITHYGLKKLNFTRLHAGIFEHNIASMKVLEKNGFVKEGICKHAIVKNKRLLDEHRYAITE